MPYIKLDAWSSAQLWRMDFVAQVPDYIRISKDKNWAYLVKTPTGGWGIAKTAHHWPRDQEWPADGAECSGANNMIKFYGWQGQKPAQSDSNSTPG